VGRNPATCEHWVFRNAQERNTRIRTAQNEMFILIDLNRRAGLALRLSMRTILISRARIAVLAISVRRARSAEIAPAMAGGVMTTAIRHAAAGMTAAPRVGDTRRAQQHNRKHCNSLQVRSPQCPELIIAYASCSFALVTGKTELIRLHTTKV